MMNMPTFLATVDAIALTLEADDLRAVVHELCRQAPEDERYAIVRLLHTYASSAKGVVKIDANEGGGLLSRLDEVMGDLVEIDSGERVLRRITNEEWDDWYDDEEDEYEFEDDAGIADVVQRALSLVHECLDEGRYRWGFELCGFLSRLSVVVEDDVWDDGTYHISDLFRHDLVAGSIEEFVGEAAVLTLWATEGEWRVAALWKLLENTRCYAMRLEDVLRKGPSDLPDFHGFLSLWITLLGRKQGFNAEHLLSEAIGMLDGPDEAFDEARMLVTTHPEVFVQILLKQASAGENVWVETRGLESMGLIPDSYTVRAIVALITAETALRLGHVDVAESCWLEAFRSDTTALTYLRLRMGVRDWDSISHEVRDIYETCFAASRTGRDARYKVTASSRNVLQLDGYCTILFCEGRLYEAMKLGISDANVNHWSNSFLSGGIALFLLLLFEGGYEKLPDGLSYVLGSAIRHTGFSEKGYCMGTSLTAEAGDVNCFLDVFNAWKKTVAVSSDEARCWLRVIEDGIDRHVDAVMKVTSRAEYHECAAYVAALGEVRESRGETGEKVRALLAMRKRYPRHSNFVQDLRSFGMPDWRRR